MSFVTAFAHGAQHCTRPGLARTAEEEDVDQLATDSQFEDPEPIGPARTKQGRKRKSATTVDGVGTAKRGKGRGRQSAKRTGGAGMSRGPGRGREAAEATRAAMREAGEQESEEEVGAVKGGVVDLSRFAYDPTRPLELPSVARELPPSLFKHPTRSNPLNSNGSSATTQPSTSAPPVLRPPSPIKLDPSQTFIMPEFDEDGEPIYPTANTVQPVLTSDSAAYELDAGDKIGQVELTRLSQEGLNLDAPWPDDVGIQDPIRNSLIGQSGILDDDEDDERADISFDGIALATLHSTPGRMFSPYEECHSSPVRTSPGPGSSPAIDGGLADEVTCVPLDDKHDLLGGSMAAPEDGEGELDAAVSEAVTDADLSTPVFQPLQPLMSERTLGIEAQPASTSDLVQRPSQPSPPPRRRLPARLDPSAFDRAIAGLSTPPPKETKENIRPPNFALGGNQAPLGQRAQACLDADLRFHRVNKARPPTPPPPTKYALVPLTPEGTTHAITALLEKAAGDARYQARLADHHRERADRAEQELARVRLDRADTEARLRREVERVEGERDRVVAETEEVGDQYAELVRGLDVVAEAKRGLREELKVERIVKDVWRGRALALGWKKGEGEPAAGNDGVLAGTGQRADAVVAGTKQGGRGGGRDEEGSLPLAEAPAKGNAC